MNVGLIGKGYWGTILLPKLEKISNVKFICGSKEDYKSKLDLVDWVFVATPNDTHFDIVQHCIKSEKNVFCEKPLTPTYKQSLKLFELADKYKVKLYVDDVFNWRNEAFILKKGINKTDKIKVTWNRESDNKLYDLLYHDLYLLYSVLSDVKNINWPLINNVTFEYKGFNKKHIINGVDFTHTKNSNDALMEMVISVLKNKVDYKYNRIITLFCNKVIDDISNNPNL